MGDKLLGALEALDLPPLLHFNVHVLIYSHVVSLASTIDHEDAAVSETGLSADEWTDLQWIQRTVDEQFMAELPHFSRLFGRLGAMADGYDMDLDDLFELGLGLILDGVEALAQRTAGRSELYRRTTPEPPQEHPCQTCTSFSAPPAPSARPSPPSSPRAAARCAP
jgi:hypothetical protein